MYRVVNVLIRVRSLVDRVRLGVRSGPIWSGPSMLYRQLDCIQCLADWKG